jgi:dienelactone hydrolase family protein
MLHGSRRAFLLGTVATTIGVRSARGGTRPLERDVPWLAEVQRPPDPPDPKAPVLSPLLVADGKPITSLDSWRRRRAEIRKAWLDYLKPLPTPHSKPVLKILAEDRPAGCVRQLVQYEGEPGEIQEGYLLKPDPCSPGRPGVVVLHQTTDHTIREPSGVEGDVSLAFGLALARRGLVAFCPGCFLWRGAGSRLDRVAAFQQRHPGSKGMAKMLWDAGRGLDVLETVAEVDAGRLGAAGHSLGAKETLYLAAFDDRVQAAVFSEGGIGIRFSNWEAPWYLGPEAIRPQFTHEHHELLALVAPRPFLILAGEAGAKNSPAADGIRSWPFVDAALAVYRLYGSPQRVGLFNHGQGHRVPTEAAERLYQWLQTYLS